MRKRMCMCCSLLVTAMICLMSAPVYAGSWEYEESVDELTDETQSVAKYRDGREEFGVICVGDDPMVLGTVERHLGADRELTGAYRFRGDEDTGVVEYRFTTGSGGNSFRFQAHDGPEIVEWLARSTELVVRIRDFRDRSRTYTYPLDGSRAALEQLECISFDDDGTLASHDTGDDRSSWRITDDGESAMNVLSGEVFMAISCPNSVIIGQDERLAYRTEDETIGGVGFTADDEEVKSTAYTFDYHHDQGGAVLGDDEKFAEFVDAVLQSDEVIFVFSDITDDRHTYTFDLTDSEEVLTELDCIDVDPEVTQEELTERERTVTEEETDAEHERATVEEEAPEEVQDVE